MTVTDVNEGPEISRSGITPRPAYLRTRTSGHGIGPRYTATDPEDPSAAITRWSTSGRDGGDFVISERGELRFRTSPDFEGPADGNRDNVYEVTIRASDGHYTGSLAETQIITVTNVNEAPVITTRSRTEFTLRENSAAVIYTYRATDPDREDLVRWSVEGADGGDFAIYNGILTFGLLPDYEEPADFGRDNVYDITVVAFDPLRSRDTVDATITVTEVNEGPKVSGTTAFTVVEGQQLVGASFTANDQEGDEVTRWSLSGSDGGDFQISESGAMTFRNLPDYDTPADSNRDNEYLVSVRAYDSGNRYRSLDVTITVTDVNEEAPVVTGRNTLSFRENTATTTRLYAYRATDSDRNTVFTWTVEGTDGGDFTITRDSSGRGELYFSSPPDHEQPADQDLDNVYEITVVAFDSTNRGTLDVAVTVTEVNDVPTIALTPPRTDSSFTVSETQQLNNELDVPGATFTATDQDAASFITRWSLTGDRRRRLHHHRHRRPDGAKHGPTSLPQPAGRGPARRLQWRQRVPGDHPGLRQPGPVRFIRRHGNRHRGQRTARSSPAATPAPSERTAPAPSTPTVPPTPRGTSSPGFNPGARTAACSRSASGALSLSRPRRTLTNQRMPTTTMNTN